MNPKALTLAGSRSAGFISCATVRLIGTAKDGIKVRWLNTYPGETLLFVAHGGVFDALHQHLIGPRVGAESKHATPYVAQPSPGGWTLSAMGEGSH